GNAERGRSDLAGEDERDDEREQHQRLDQRQTENHRGLNARGRAGIAADALESGRGSATLTETTTEHRQANRDGSADRGSGARATRSRFRTLGERRGCGE